MDHIISLRNHLEMLSENIGARPTGSAKNNAAVEYAFESFQKCGLQVRKQEFSCMDWKNSGAALRIDNRDIPVEPAEYSLPCDTTAEFICIDTVDTLRNAELSGKIAVLHGDLCKEPLMPKNFEFYNPDEHKQIIALLEGKNPTAIITVISGKEHIIQDGDFNIPCAVISADMLDVFLHSFGGRAKLTINTERIPVKAHNVIATYGTKKHKMCFSAHIDTKPATPGALDNASGVSALLAFAESLSGKHFPFQIEIVLFNGEDYYSCPGEMAFMGGLSMDYILAVNVDGIGLKNCATSVSFYSCSKKIENRIMERVEKTTGVERIEPWPMGDHMIFATFGVPTIAITASDIFGLLNTIIHSSDDNTENIDMNVLNNAVQFLSSCVNGWENDMNVFYLP